MSNATSTATGSLSIDCWPTLVHNPGMFISCEHRGKVNDATGEAALTSRITNEELFTESEHSNKLSPDHLLQSALRRLAEVELDAVVETAGRDAIGHGLDALVRVYASVGSELYAVQIKSKVSPGSAAAVHPPKGRRILVIAPYVSESVADVWRHRDIHYVDAAGNMYLHWRGLLVDVRGRRRPAGPRPAEPGRPLRVFKRTGLRVLFALLCVPELIAAPYRDLAHYSGASLGTVQWVVKELEGAGYVSSDPHVRRLHRVGDLFTRWVQAYALDLWPRLTLGRYESQDPIWWTKADQALRKEDAQWGGETAAHRLNPHLRPEKAVIYAPMLPKRLILDHRLRKADDEGNVEIRQRFWNFPHAPSQLIVPTPLIYADLIASADPRQLEAADYLRAHDGLLRRINRG